MFIISNVTFRIRSTSAVAEAPTVHQQTRDTDISNDNMLNAAYETLDPDLTASNHGGTETETSDRLYQTLLPDPHDYEYPNLAEIVTGNTDIPTPTNPPRQSGTDNTRQYLELTDDSNSQQDIGMTREYLELIDESNGQQTTVVGPE